MFTEHFSTLASPCVWLTECLRAALQQVSLALSDYASLDGAGARSSAQAPAIATAQTGSMVTREGRSVSLANCEVRSNAATSHRSALMTSCRE